MSDLFISYSSRDSVPAFELVDELRAKGYSVWIDKGGIVGAANWSSAIVNALNACSTVLLLISPNSVMSESVAREIHLASEKKKNILPVILEKARLPAALEYALAGIQQVYFSDKKAIHEALKKLHLLKTDARRITDDVVPVPVEKFFDGSIYIAVLPFDDLSPEHDNQWFADGMMDELIGTLRYINGVKVPGRWDVLQYRDHRVRTRDIARELGVRYIIEGAVRKADGKIRINASLLDAERSEQIWADKFDGSFDNVFDFQESVSKQIADALRLSLSTKEEEKIEEKPTRNAEAYELYLRGREQQYLLTKEGYQKALELYEQAIKLDPDFTDAYILAASVCNVYFREYSRNHTWLKRAELYLESAKSIAGETAKTLSLQGEIEWLNGNHLLAIPMLIQASSLDPKYYKTFGSLGNLYVITGNNEKAVEAFQHVIEIDQTTTNYFNLLSALSALNQPERLKTIAKNAIPIFDRYVARKPDDQTAVVHFAFTLFWAGETEQASNLAGRLSSMSDLGGHALYNLGCLYDELGEPRRYIDLLREAIEKGYREIEQTRNYKFTTHDSECEGELSEVITKLEGLIAEEGDRKEKSEAVE